MNNLSKQIPDIVRFRAFSDGSVSPPENVGRALLKCRGVNGGEVRRRTNLPLSDWEVQQLVWKTVLTSEEFPRRDGGN